MKVFDLQARIYRNARAASRADIAARLSRARARFLLLQLGRHWHNPGPSRCKPAQQLRDTHQASARRAPGTRTPLTGIRPGQEQGTSRIGTELRGVAT